MAWNPQNVIELFSCGDVRKNPETTIRIVKEGKDLGVLEKRAVKGRRTAWGRSTWRRRRWRRAISPIGRSRLRWEWRRGSMDRSEWKATRRSIWRLEIWGSFTYPIVMFCDVMICVMNVEMV